MLLFSIQSISAATIAVHPGDSIQNTVNNAADGDNITVYDNNQNPYTYKESISINKKINIKASGNVTIEAKNTSSAVFTVNSNGAGSSIQNFILTKSSYCIMINNANSCKISNNVISGASLVGIQFYGNMYNSVVTGNRITGLDPSVGNGISFEYGTCTNNTVYGNNVSNFLNGIIFNDNSENNTVQNNMVSCTGYSGAGIYTTDNAKSMRIIGNTVTGAEDGIAVQQVGSNTALFGVPDGRYKYMSDGTIYNTYDEMMAHVNQLEQQHGQEGPLPTVWHGTVRTDSPLIDPGCGFPLYFQILTKTYGIIPAYVYTAYGLFSIYLYSPYWKFELTHASELQTLYNEGALNLDKNNVASNVDKYYENLSKTGNISQENLTNYD